MPGFIVGILWKHMTTTSEMLFEKIDIGDCRAFIEIVSTVAHDATGLLWLDLMDFGNSIICNLRYVVSGIVRVIICIY